MTERPITLATTLPEKLLKATKSKTPLNEPSLLAVTGNLTAVPEIPVSSVGFWAAVSGVFVTVALIYTGGLQGTGDTRSPLYISIVSQVVIPIGLCTYVDVTRGLEPSDIWLAIVLGHIARAVLSVFRFQQGKWRDIAVNIESTTQ